MALPTTKRGSDQKDRSPNGEALIKAMEVAATPEAALYLAEAFAKKMQALGPAMVEKGKEVLQTLKEFYDNVVLQRREHASIWSGKQSAQTDFQNLQQNLAAKATQEVRSRVQGGLKMDFAIDEQSSHFVRGFSSEGKPIDQRIADSMDKLLNAWFAENNLISKNSVIYQGTKNGQILRDASGNPLKAEAEKIKGLLANREKGFQKFLADKNLQASIQQHKYPEQKVEAAKQTTQQKQQPSRPETIPYESGHAAPSA